MPCAEVRVRKRYSRQGFRSIKPPNTPDATRRDPSDGIVAYRDLDSFTKIRAGQPVSMRPLAGDRADASGPRDVPICPPPTGRSIAAAQVVDALHPTHDPGALLQVRDLAKSYSVAGRRRMVFSDVSLSLEIGETCALTGESGSGKSTLLHLIGALDDFDTGEITIAGTSLSGLDETERAALRRTRIGLVFQQFNLIGSLNVARNLSFQARLAGRHDAAWMAHITERLGLAGLAGHYPEHLSGGQQQRVAIGRALAPRPALLLADEPTGNLDEATGDAVLDLMLELVADAGTALFLVTHSTRVAARLGRRLHLSSGALA